ncbi:MAG: hypothetical protein JXB39_01095, partial [Deltaproteobacteria bacterium]|nr:hypothetical protein [Deltaproteobacteria bacterium]
GGHTGDTGGHTGDTGGHTGDTGGHTGDTGDSCEEGVCLLSWRLHEEMESLVYVSWEQTLPGTVHVEYSFDPDVWLSTPSFLADKGSQEQLVVGIPFATEAAWRVVLEEVRSFDGESIVTGPVPTGLPLCTVTVADETAWLSTGKYLLSSINQRAGGWTGGTYWTFIMDRQCRVVWARAAPDSHWTLFASVSLDGSYLMWDEATYWSDWDHGAGSSIHKTWLDEEFEEFPAPGLHHTFVELPDGTLAWGSQDHGGEEALVERGPDDEDETILWTCEEDWPGSRSCESNGLFYQASTDTFLYSFYTNNSVVEVSRSEGTSLWWAGTVSDDGTSRRYTFDPTNSQFSWQHGISYTASGTLLLSTEARFGSTTITAVREYEVDHESGLLRNVWTFNSGVYASTNGDAWRLSNGNTLHVLGAAGQIMEADPEGRLVWHVDYHAQKLLGRGEFIEDLYALVKPSPDP